MATPNGQDAVSIMPLRLTLLLFGCIALIVINTVTRWVILKDIEGDALLATQTWATKGLLHNLQGDLALLESGQRGYLLTGDATYLGQYRHAEERVPGTFSQLKLLLRAESRQNQLLAELEKLTTRKLQELSGIVALVERGNRAEALRIVNSDYGRVLMERASALISTMVDGERASLIAQNGKALQQFRTATYVSVSIGLVTLIALIVLYGYTLGNLRQRRQVEDALQQANESLEAKVNSRTVQLAHLSRHLLTLAETEKAALATELHDVLGSNLTAIILDVSAVGKRLEKADPRLAEKLERALKTLYDTVDLKRRIIHGLRPSMLDSLGLPAAMRMDCEDFTRRTGLPCRVDIPDDLGELQPAWNIALYRIAQESLTNIAKYAHAKDVQVILRREELGVRLRIVDDGIGIESNVLDKATSHGLLGMRERVAQLGGIFAVRPGEQGIGTIVEAFVPFPGTSPAP